MVPIVVCVLPNRKTITIPWLFLFWTTQFKYETHSVNSWKTTKLFLEWLKLLLFLAKFCARDDSSVRPLPIKCIILVILVASSTDRCNRWWATFGGGFSIIRERQQTAKSCYSPHQVFRRKNSPPKRAKPMPNSARVKAFIHRSLEGLQVAQ